MTVQVETFECQETAAEPIEAAQEAIELCEQLGLTGQLNLCKRGDKPADAKRCPYRKITAEEQFVYGLLCPSRSKLKDYSASPVPLRVLQIAAHAESLGQFRELVVWDKKAMVVKDPVLLGVVQTDERYTWQVEYYILARWGEVLETFSTLLKQALAIKREALIGRAKSVLSKATTATDDEIRMFSELVS